MLSSDNVIVALDFPSYEEAKRCIDECGDAVTYYKVGMELFYATNGEIIKYLKSQGKKVFLDLKLFDIPNTVSHALRVLTRLGADMLNVHALGGKKMMSEAVKAVKEEAAALGIEPPKLIAVTILTSVDEDQFKDLNISKSIADEVISLAQLTKASGFDGVVASPREAAGIRAACGEGFLIVTPGVRPAGSSVDDQSRIATPKGAFINGSTHIVVGRPITKAGDRKAAAEAIVNEIKG